MVALVEEEHLQKVEHLHVEAGTGLYGEALRDELDLFKDFVAAAREDILEHSSNRLQVLVDVVDGQMTTTHADHLIRSRRR